MRSAGQAESRPPPRLRGAVTWLCRVCVARFATEAKTIRYVLFIALSVTVSALGEELPLFYDYVENGQLRGGKILIDPADPLHRATFGLDAPLYTPLWAVTTIVDNGPSENRIDLVMLGDGYTSAELDDYATHVDNVLAAFFEEEPLEAYASYFNVHRVDVVSNESGVDEPDYGIYRDTALDMTYNCFGIPRLLCVDAGKALAAAAYAPDLQQILVLANSTRYGGSGDPVNNLSTLAGDNSASVELALHEFAHSFADLGDEYEYGLPGTYTGPELIDANVSIYDAAAQVALQAKWWRWMPLSHIDAFEGAGYYLYGLYRPTYNSKMRSLNRPFEEVNNEQFVFHVYEVVSPIDDATPASVEPLSGCTTFFVVPLEPQDHALAVQWSVDGLEVPGETDRTFAADVTSLEPGIRQVSVTVADNTTRVRDETARALWMTDTRQWEIVVLGIQDECEVQPPALAASPHDARKNRYLSFDPNNTSAIVAFEVDLAASYEFPTSTGTLGWVGEPDGNDLSRLVSLPYYTNAWPAVVHLADCQVIPVATYEIRATDDAVVFTDPLEVATIHKPGERYYGDVVGLGTGELPPLPGFTPPNGVVNVTDVQAFVLTFQGASSPSTHPTWVDLHGEGDGCPPNFVVNVSDLQRIKFGFQGQRYDDAPDQWDPADCP